MACIIRSIVTCIKDISALIKRRLNHSRRQLHVNDEENQLLYENKLLYKNQQLHEENQQQKRQLHQLCEEKQQLHVENQQQKRQLHQLCEEKQQLHVENQQQKRQLQQLHGENQQQKQQLQQLHEENQQQKQHLHGEKQLPVLQLQKKQQLHEANEKFQRNSKHQALEDNQEQLHRENQELQKQIEKLQKENQKFREEQQDVNEKGSAQSHEDISDKFQEHYDYMENEIPNNLGIKNVANKQEFWKKCCHLYQTSYDICYDEIHSVFNEALTSITRLSKEEEEHGEVVFSRRRKNIKNAKSAYEYLLMQCSVQLNEFDKTQLVTKVLESFNADDHEWLQEEVEIAVEICWKMQTVSPPMFLCQPTKHNESWHEIHNKSWHEGPGELIYYRPVVMYSAGGIVACKGFIGKTSNESNVISPCTSFGHSGANIYKKDVCMTQIAVCSGCQMECQDTQETINHNGKYWHEKCLPICSKCKNYVDINESRKSGKHHYHYDCFKCHHCHNTIPTSKDSHSWPDGSIWCKRCYYKLCLCCHNEIRSATSQSHCDNCMHKISMSICFECNQKIEVHDEKTTTNQGIFHKTCICDCQDAPAYNHLKICSKCNKKRY